MYSDSIFFRNEDITMHMLDFLQAIELLKFGGVCKFTYKMVRENIIQKYGPQVSAYLKCFHINYDDEKLYKKCLLLLQMISYDSDRPVKRSRVLMEIGNLI